MKCHQCERPAFYKYSQDVGLCIKCFERKENIFHMQFLRTAAMINLADHELNNALGIDTHESPIPVAALAMANKGKEKVYNNIHINNSNVGVVNTGDLAKIDAVITLTRGSDAEQIGTELKNLTEAIINFSEGLEKDKQELIELIQMVAEQIQSTRKKSVLLSLLDGIGTRIQRFNTAITIYEKLRSLIENIIF
jgi:hypothetical protein